MADWGDRLGRWLAPFVERFGHKAWRRMGPLYVAGLIGPGDRKSVGPTAERVAQGNYDRLHHFVSDGVWDEAPLDRELAIQADKLVGGADVNAGRKTIPFARFDAKRCAQGLESLRAYRVEWDEKARAFKKTPEHNWASHGADAWRYLSLAWRAPMREPEEKKAPIGIPLPDLTMDQFIDLEDEWSLREDRV
jgi:hypothetical protein